ncbi:BatC protein [Flavobacterium aquatile]|nr:BatC protein [Flavobacterium aquatile]
MLTTFALQAQEKDKYLPKGNEEFASKNYVDAEANYRISQAKFAKKSKSSYNLGTSIYKQNQPEEAKYQFARAIQDAKTKSEKHSAFHNFGNTLMKEKNYEGAVQAYKDALRNNPSDEQTRYNYALAKKMLKDHPPKNDDKKDKDKNKDKKDEKDKEKDKDKKDDNKDKNKDKKDGDDKKDKQDKPQPKPSGANKQRIDNLLDAVSNEEKKVQEKVNAQKVQGKPQKPEKDW